jgi:hypothetical protein
MNRCINGMQLVIVGNVHPLEEEVLAYYSLPADEESEQTDTKVSADEDAATPPDAPATTEEQ